MNALLATLLTLGSLACQSATVAQDAAGTSAVTSNRHDANHSQLSVAYDGDALVLVVGPDDATAILNGKPVPADRIVREGDRLSVLDEDGEVVFDVRVIDGGGLAYPYDADLDLIIGRRDPFLRFQDADTRWNVLSGVATNRRKLIGVTTTSVYGVLADQLDLEPGGGFVIDSVSDGKPADVAGMRVNDIVVAIEGESPANTKLLREHMASREAGDELHMSVLRRGERLELLLVLREPEPSGANGLWSDRLDVLSNLGYVSERRFPEMTYLTTALNESVALQQVEMAAVEEQLARAASDLDVYLADLRDAGDGQDSTLVIEASRRGMEQAQAAMERLQDTSALLRARTLSRAPLVGIVSGGEDGERSLYVPRATIVRSAPPAVSVTRRSAPDLDDRLERMEERMVRLEELLERLLESGDGR